MKSAGKRCSKRSWLAWGAPNCANGMDPESNHTSITSGTRFMSPPQLSQVRITSSTNGRCGSWSFTPDSRSSSASEPMTFRHP